MVVGVNPPGTFSPPSPTDMLSVHRGRRCSPPPTASRAPPLLRRSASRTERTRLRPAAAAATPRGGGGAHKLPPPPPALPRPSPLRHKRRGRACSVVADVGVPSAPSQRGRRSHRDARRHPTADGANSHAVRGKPQSAAHSRTNGGHRPHVWLPTTVNLWANKILPTPTPHPRTRCQPSPTTEANRAHAVPCEVADKQTVHVLEPRD